MQKNRIIIIGLGYHARRIHFPIISELKNAEVVGVVDLKKNQSQVEAFLKELDVPSKVSPLYLTGKQSTTSLTAYAKQAKANSVVISTGPDTHVKYALWAFANGLHVIMDKPIHAETNSAHDAAAAKQIQAEFVRLEKALQKARDKYPKLICEVLTQRRFHPAYQLIKKTIDDVYAKTDCPITYYYSFHNDGQWRTPEEIISIDYHGFNEGYGKASHSGYHFYDLLNWFTAGMRDDKSVNNVLVKSWANFPQNYVYQVGPKTLNLVFPNNRFAGAIKSCFVAENFGEIDVMSTLQLKSNKNVVTHAQIDLLHSGISARSWPTANMDSLYKGNGRVRHEQHYINLGPFASISLTSWQSKPFNSEELKDNQMYKPGHEFNLDITICRNSAVIGGKPVELFQLGDIYKPVLGEYSRGHQEDARRNALVEFFGLIDQGVVHGSSPLESHKFTSLLMSSVYESMAVDKQVFNKM